MPTRRAEIHPCLDLDKSSARRAGAYVRCKGKTGILGNGLIEIEVDFSHEGKEWGVALNKLTRERIALEFSPFEAWFDSGKVSGEGVAFGAIESRGSADFSSLSVHARHDWFDVEVFYTLQRGHHFFRKSIAFRNFKRRGLLHKVSLCRHVVAPECQVLLHDGGMYFPLVFLRARKGGLFYCGDFPGYFASADSNGFSFDYYPGEILEPGRSFQTLGIHIGLCALAGRTRANRYHERGAELDVGEMQWFREHLLLEAAYVPELPFLELKAPEYGIRGVSEPELLSQCEWFGARHVYLPYMLEALDSYPLAQGVERRLREEGLHAALTVSQDKTPNLHWVALASDGSPASPDLGGCFASEPFRNDLIESHTDLIERHALRGVELGGSPIVACYATGHGHAPGVESIQMAFQGVVEVAEAFRETCGHVRCGAPYGTYGAGLTRLFDSVAILSEQYPLPLPDIHIGRLFADMGRLYFRRSHDFLLPKSKLFNSVGLVPESCPDAPYPGAEHYPWYLYHDSAGWRYGLISALATGLRHRFQAVPQDFGDDSDRAFGEKWLKWENEHLAELMEVEEILDEPGLDAVDGYSYANARGAIVFLFNCTYDSQNVALNLRLSHDADYIVRELYPKEMNYLGPNDGLFRRNSRLTLQLDPKEARVIEAVRRSPATARRKRAQIFGAEGCEEAGVVKLRGKPGARVTVGIRTKGSFEKHRIKFPGRSWTPHIDDWVYTQRSLEEGVVSLPKGGFSGDPVTPNVAVGRNVWLTAQLLMPEDVKKYVDTSPFRLAFPCWAYAKRLFFVVRFEPTPSFDPIRTSSRTPGIPEAHMASQPIKCGIDLTPLNLGLKAWLNGNEREVYPALAAWNGFMPNPHPTVAYFFEAGSALNFGKRNRVVLFASHFDAAAFRGIFIEHLPDVKVEHLLDSQ
ncbi:MAG TPA: hypothetical protein HPP77_01135 [Candidatus Hydrogenedentes bacterium]|nr:hypothetical protein [Candidatus Hydrogenedentota bacterium]